MHCLAGFLTDILILYTFPIGRVYKDLVNIQGGKNKIIVKNLNSTNVKIKLTLK